MNSKSRPVRVGAVGAPGESKARPVVAPLPAKPAKLGLPVLRWEYKVLYEKDEEFEIVYQDGRPVVSDAWVLVYFLAPNGEETVGEFEQKMFDKYVLPALYRPTLAYWMEMAPENPFSRRRKDVLADLMEQGERLGL